MRSSARWGLAAFAAVLLGAALTAQPAVADRTLSLSNGNLKLSLRPGSAAEDRLTVANTGNEPLRALIYTTDIIADKKGDPLYPRPKGGKKAVLGSPASWISLKVPEQAKIVASQPYLEMEPGEEFPIDLSVRVPVDAAPGDYEAAVFFEIFDLAGKDKDAVSRVSGRIGTRITFRVVGKATGAMGLRPYGIRTVVIGDVAPFSFTVRNDGNIDKRYSARLVVVDSADDEVLTSNVETSAVAYAQARRKYNGGLGLRGVGLGRYTVCAQIDFAKETDSKAGETEQASLSEERVVWVIPLWAAIGAVVVTGLPLLWASWRIGSRPRSKAKGRRGRRSSPRGAPRRSQRVRRGETVGPDPVQVAEDDSLSDHGEGKPGVDMAVEAEESVTLFDQHAEPAVAPDVDVRPAATGADWVPDELFEDLPGGSSRGTADRPGQDG